MNWTEAEVETLRTLWAKGLSASRIGARMGATRNAVLGVIHRRGMPARLTPQRPYQRTLIVRKRVAAPIDPVETLARDIAPTLADPSPDDVIGILQLTERTCRWPIGDPQDAGFGFCGRDAVLGKPYCSGHAVVAFEPPKKRARTDFAIRTNRILEAAE